MEQNTICTNGNKEMVKQPNSLDKMLETYLTLLGEQIKVKNRAAKLEIEIKDVEGAINRELKFNSDVGKLVKVNDRIFCCLKGEVQPIVIEME